MRFRFLQQTRTPLLIRLILLIFKLTNRLHTYICFLFAARTGKKKSLTESSAVPRKFGFLDGVALDPLGSSIAAQYTDIKALDAAIASHSDAMRGTSTQNDQFCDFMATELARFSPRHRPKVQHILHTVLLEQQHKYGVISRSPTPTKTNPDEGDDV